MNHIRTITDVHDDYRELLGLEARGSKSYSLTLVFNGRALVSHPYIYRDALIDIRECSEAAFPGGEAIENLLLERIADDKY